MTINASSRRVPMAERAFALCQILLLLGLSLGAEASPAVARQQGAGRWRRAVARPRRGATPVRGANNRLARRINQRGRFLSFQLSEPVRREGEREAELRDERLDWFILQRTYPSPFFNLPPLMRSQVQNLLMQSEQFDRTLELQPLKSRPFWKPFGSPAIESFGPKMSPTTGRVTAVAVSPADPRVILIGAATGGIWRSEDGGDSFRPVSDNQSELAVGSIAFSTKDPSVVYAGMGDRIGGYMGTGVLKSTDGGLHWRKVSGNSLPPSTVTKVLVSPLSPRRVYIAEYKFRDPQNSNNVWDGGFRFSDDGGASWSEAIIHGRPRDLALHPSEPDTLYLSLTNHRDPAVPFAAVFKTRDGGKHWRPILVTDDVGLPGHSLDFKLGVTPAAPELLYVAVTHVNPKGARRVELIASGDGGKSWGRPVPITRRDIADKVVEFLAVDPRDPHTIYLGSEDLFKSTDGGLTWVNLSNNFRIGDDGGPVFQPAEGLTHVDQRDFAFSPADPKVVYVANDGGIWRSDNGGQSHDGVRAFRPLHTNLPVTQLLSITTHPEHDDTAYAGTQDNGALILTGGETRWREFVTGDSGGIILDEKNSDLAYVNFYYGNINSYNNGAFIAELAHNSEFCEPDPPKRPRIAVFPPFVLAPPTGALYLGTWRLFKSVDGDHWNAVSPPEDILTKGDREKFGPDVLSAIGVSPDRAGVIYTGSAYGKVMMTTDDGEHWKEITGTLPNRFVKSIVVAPHDPRTVYVTFSGFGDGHVFKTTDAGARWKDLGGCPPALPLTGWCLPNLPANALLLDPYDENIIYVGTDAGIFRTTTGGALWHPFNEGLPPVVVTDFAVTRDGRIVVATYGRGAFELAR